MTGDTKKEIRLNIYMGYRVGKLTVAASTDQRKNGYTIWRCQCDCGGEILLDTRCLQRGTIRDCGCETVVRPGQRDITGQRFGKLTALWPTGMRGRGGSLIWHCKCDCGGEVDAPLQLPEQTSPEGLHWEAVWEACGTKVRRQMEGIAPVAVPLRLRK